MPSLIRTVLRSDVEMPHVERMEVTALIEDLGVGAARDHLQEVQAGEVELIDCISGSMVFISCLPEERAQLATEIEAAVMSSGRKNIMKIPAAERQQLAASSQEPGVLQLLAQDRRSVKTRAAVAENPNTPEFVLEQLAETDVSCEVLLKVGMHPSTPASTLDHLTDLIANSDKKLLRAWVPSAVARNPNSSPDTLAKLLDTLFAAGDQYVLQSTAPFVLDNDNFPAAAREAFFDAAMSTSADRIQRKITASCESAGRARLSRLAADADHSHTARHTLDALDVKAKSDDLS